MNRSEELRELRRLDHLEDAIAAVRAAIAEASADLDEMERERYALLQRIRGEQQ